jgi:hypothetical protein
MEGSGCGQIFGEYSVIFIEGLRKAKYIRIIGILVEY